MNYQQFVSATKEQVDLLLGEDIHSEIHSTLKNNGQMRFGLTISKANTHIFPTIYLEESYQQFLKGCPLESIAENIARVYCDVDKDRTWHVDAIKDFPAIKSKIAYKLIHADKNKFFLEGHPHVPYLDLAIVFYILFEADESGIATIPITNELLTFWEISIDTLYAVASENMKELLPASFLPMHNVIEELLGKCGADVFHAEEELMYVLTNSLRNYGAASILYEGILEQIAGQLGESFYILPSSIHEMIIVPEHLSPERSDLDDMVSEINDTQLSVEEVLSDHAYYYDYDLRCLS